MRLFWFSTTPKPPRLGLLASLLAGIRIGLWLCCYRDNARDKPDTDV